VGELSKELEKAQGPNSKLLSSEKNKTHTLKDAGLTIPTASRYGKI